MMLQFWKKSGLNLGKKDKAGDKGPASPSRNSQPAEKSPTLRNKYSHRSAGPLAGFTDEEMVASVCDKLPLSRRSRLSKSLCQVLRDEPALGCFRKYLESRHSLPLLDFWLEVEDFRAQVLANHEPGEPDQPDAGACPPSAFDQSAEAERIYRRYLSPMAMRRVSIDPDIAEGVARRLTGVAERQATAVDGNALDNAQLAAFHLLESRHFGAFQRSEFHGQHQMDVLTGGHVTIDDILWDHTALGYFTEFMEQEGSQRLLEFWLAAVSFQHHLVAREGSYDAAEAQDDAMVLYDKYFSMQATCPLGFGDRIRLAVEQDICREDGPQPDCFQLPVAIVQQALEKHYLASFLSSQLNMKYLTELVNSIQASPALLNRHRKTGSESSSDWSVSTQGTRLGGEEPAAATPTTPTAARAGEMCIDSRQLNDPDALWRRRKHNGLRFGRINHMGRFETDVEPEPDRKEESRIARAVKKLVNMEEDKAKEEMAWQIAEMIVKDVTSLTLGSSRSEGLNLT